MELYHVGKKKDKNYQGIRLNLMKRIYLQKTAFYHFQLP